MLHSHESTPNRIDIKALIHTFYIHYVGGLHEVLEYRKWFDNHLLAGNDDCLQDVPMLVGIIGTVVVGSLGGIQYHGRGLVDRGETDPRLLHRGLGIGQVGERW